LAKLLIDILALCLVSYKRKIEKEDSGQLFPRGKYDCASDLHLAIRGAIDFLGLIIFINLITILSVRLLINEEEERQQ